MQLGLFDEESINKYINDEMAEHFYKLDPSERQIKDIDKNKHSTWNNG